MYLKDIIFYKFKTKLKQTLFIKDVAVRYRENIICKFINTNHEIVWSEMSPLKNFNQDTLFHSYLEFLRIKNFLLGIDWNWEKLFSETPYLCFLSNKNLFPSLHFCIEIAIYKFFTNKSGNIAKSNIKIPINILVINTSKNLNAQQLKSIHTTNCQAIKLKLSHLKIQEAIKFVQAIIIAKLSTTTMRLDINSKWSFTQFIDFIKYFNPVAFEYIEEPVNSLKKLKLLSRESHYPIALDESLQAFSLATIFSFSSIKAIIIKPGLVGNLQEVINLLNLAFKKDIIPIFTGIFESDIGIMNILCLIYNLDIYLPVGFDTYNWIQDEFLLLANQLYCKNNYLYVCFHENINVKAAKLQEI